jgi:hypothetical protein
MVSWAIVNGKLYLAYDGTTNRLKVFDPGLSTTTTRYAGMGTPAAATVANGGGAGAYPAVLRYYRIAYIEVRGGVTVRRSQLGPLVSFTPGGANANATVTKPASISEGETHWEVYGSADDALYYALAANVDDALSAAILVATTTYADTTLVGNYANFGAAPQEGANTPFPSVKSLGTDGSRLYGFGVWETTAGDSMTPKSGRFYFGPVLDSSSVHDDERINNTTTLVGYLDLARNASGTDTGVSQRPVNNIIFAFQTNGIFEIYPTESDIVPYRRVVRSTQIGNLTQRMIAVATDRHGSPCCFFVDPIKGPYMAGGADGLVWCSKDVSDVWETVDLENTANIGWTLWVPSRQQVIFAVCVSGAAPTLALVLDVSEQEPDEKGDLRNGWTVYDGDFVQRMGVLFSNTLAATRSRTKVPYTGGAKLLRYDETVDRDDTTNFQAYVRSGALIAEARAAQLDRAYIYSSAQTGVSVRHRLIRAAGAENRDSTVSLAPIGTETIVIAKAQEAAAQDASILQVEIGDAAAANVHWHFYRWQGSVTLGGAL